MPRTEGRNEIELAGKGALPRRTMQPHCRAKGERKELEERTTQALQRRLRHCVFSCNSPFAPAFLKMFQFDALKSW